MRRPAKPKPPPSADFQAAIDAVRILAAQDKAAGKWPANAAAGSLLEALHRMEEDLKARPDHPDHAAWKEKREAMNRPAHRR